MEMKENNIQNPALLLAMKVIRSENTEENMLKVLSEAVKAKFILPVEGNEEGKMRFHAVQGDEGRIYQIVYADSISFNNAFPSGKQNGIVAGFMDLADLVLNENSKINGFVVNPGAEEVLFREDMLKTIIDEFKKDGIIKESDAPKSANIKVGDPDRLPDGMGNATIDFGASRDEIFRIFIQLMQREGKDKPEWLFVVDHAGKTDEVLKELGNKVGPHLDGLDFVMIDMGDPMAEKIIKGKMPVYAK
ncbi:MAG: enhanced serine sensitivity protein SseB C-terminal domain-containing protein [Clostridiales bacterium]|nr:enhanced serine sensitivity protein SseB C-terminal domain-containing protein [Clostridiales bacterium]